MAQKGFGVEIIKAFASGFGGEIGAELVRRLSPSEDRSSRPDDVSALAVNSYLTGRAFASFSAPQVERWAGYRLEQMGAARARLVVAASAASSDGTVQSALNEIVRHLAREANIL